MPEKTVLNITMPVFNRISSTQPALLALSQSNRYIPFSITVVDNGSDKILVDKLRQFKKMAL